MKTTKTIPVVLTISSHKQSRKATEFFNENNIESIKKNVSGGLSTDEVVYLIKRAGGLKKIFAEKSKLYIELQELMDKEDTLMSDIVQYIAENPKVLKLPIIYDDKRFLVGYNELDIRTFLPRKLKLQYFIDSLTDTKNTVSA